MNGMKLNENQKQIILLLAENNMCLSATAKNGFRARTTVDYHIRKILKDTGLNPNNFYDLCKLVEMAKEVIG